MILHHILKLLPDLLRGVALNKCRYVLSAFLRTGRDGTSRKASNIFCPAPPSCKSVMGISSCSPVAYRTFTLSSLFYNINKKAVYLTIVTDY